MTLMDPIGDMFTRIRNGQLRLLTKVEMPSSNFRLKMALTIPIMLFGIVIGRLIFADSNTTRLVQKLKFENGGLDVFNQVASVPMASKIGLILGLSLIIIEFCFQNHKLVKTLNN